MQGTLIVAKEGLNGTVSGSREAIDRLRTWLESDPALQGAQMTESESAEPPFHRLKVLHKREIVTFGVEVDPVGSAGVRVEPEDWNELLLDPETTVIDTRNAFEVAVGSFEGALNPETASFSDFTAYAAQRLDPKVQPRIAMFCTGGVRCEKASSHLLDQGFEEVYQLRGGILSYLDKVPAEDSLWRGECFVFDRRVAVTHNLREGTYEECRNCRAPLSPEDREAPGYEKDVSCSECIDSLTPERREALLERRRQMALARKRGKAHLGAVLEPADRG